MSLGIIVAMEEELEIILKSMKKEKTEIHASMEFHIGEISGKEIIAVICGIGKVNSAVCAQILISEYDVKSIINLGIAGGIGKDVVPGDVVIGNSLIQHDMDSTAFGDPVGQIPRLDTFDFKADANLVKLAKEACRSIKEHNSYVGVIVTGDQFVADLDKIKWLSEEFNALACEMEGASIAQTCYLNNIPFVVIRSISDNANTGAHMDFEKFKYLAVKNGSEILKEMILNI